MKFLEDLSPPQRFKRADHARFAFLCSSVIFFTSSALKETIDRSLLLVIVSRDRSREYTRVKETDQPSFITTLPNTTSTRFCVYRSSLNERRRMAPSNNQFLEKIKGDVSLERERGGKKGGGFEGIPWLEDEEWDGRVLCCSESVCKKLTAFGFLMLVMGLIFGLYVYEPKKEDPNFVAYTGSGFYTPIASISSRMAIEGYSTDSFKAAQRSAFTLSMAEYLNIPSNGTKVTLVEDKVWKKRRSLKGYYGFVDVGYVAYARDMEHADELKTKIEALVYSVEGDANKAFVELLKKNSVTPITVQGIYTESEIKAPPPPSPPPPLPGSVPSPPPTPNDGGSPA